MTSFYYGYFIFSVLTTLSGCLPILTQAQYAFRSEPEDTAVQLGETATLLCSVENYQKTATVAWWNNALGQYISHNRHIKRSTLDSDKLERYSITGDPALAEFNLQIRNFSSSDVGTYKCQIFASSTTLTVRKFSHAAELTVAPFDPRCYVDSKSRMPMVGDTVDLVCESRNPDYSGHLWWMYGGMILRGNTTRSPVVRNVVTRVLTEADYDVRFMCLEQSRTCFLNPLRRYISVLIHTAVAQPQLGDTLTYRCVANDDLTPLSYSWRINGVDAATVGDELTIGPVNAPHNGSVIECAVKHMSGFKGNDSMTLHIEPTGDGTRTSTPGSTDSTPSKSTLGMVPTGTHSSIDSSLTPTYPILLDQQDASTNQDDGWNGLFTPFVICASVVGILLTTVIVLLTVFLNRQRASNRRVTDAAKSKDGAGGPPSDCVPLDLVANGDGIVNGSPAISVGTLKGFKNPAGCGSVDTFELDLDPDSQPEYYTLEHNYYEATDVGRLNLTISRSENQDSGFDGIEVSETITPDCELTSRNRKFSFGSSPPPPVPSSSAQPHTPMAIPHEFEGSSAEAESLVPAYAVTDVARSSPPAPDSKRIHARGGSLKRPLPARPTDSGYRAPNVVFADERPFRRIGSMKSLGEPAVGALARSNSLHRPLPATPRDGVLRTPCTPDPYRNPNSLITRIPPFLTSDATPTNQTTISTSETKTDPPKETDQLIKTKVPQKYPKLTVPLERLSAAISVSEGDYAEIDTDQEQEASDTDSLMSNGSTGEDDATTRAENESRSTVDIEDLAGHVANENTGVAGEEGVFENDYDSVADSDGEETDPVHGEKNSPPASNSNSDHDRQILTNLDDAVKVVEYQESSPDENAERPEESVSQKSPFYAKVKRQNTQEFEQKEADISEGNCTEFDFDDIVSQPCVVDISPSSGTLRRDISDLCQERAVLQSAEPPCALVK
ncbi:uncharacterized protein LOC119722929 [Patiria miniata]|uniref:Ig-like domain-containing protein n=1 Tax=Patiria miniata TaxID=46514 RepID=A0A913ZBV7_PATMI|nr:uncharacterized protein LOC119722929 [Patiria miniata]